MLDDYQEPDEPSPEEEAEARSRAASGSTYFAELCETLIEEEGHHWLHPIIKRSRSTEWIAEIHTRPLNDERTEKLAHGEGPTMGDACALAVHDFHERARIRARKEELMKDPNVREALELFKSNDQGLERRDKTPPRQ